MRIAMPIIICKACTPGHREVEAHEELHVFHGGLTFWNVMNAGDDAFDVVGVVFDSLDCRGRRFPEQW